VPIAPYLVGQAFDPESIKVMSDTLEKLCAELGLKLYDGKKNPAADIVAQKLIEHWRQGARSSKALYVAVMTEFKLGDQKPN
jgi:hypothetical protein